MLTIESLMVLQQLRWQVQIKILHTQNQFVNDFNFFYLKKLISFII